MSGLIEGASSGSTQVHKSDPYKRNTLPWSHLTSGLTEGASSGSTQVHKSDPYVLGSEKIRLMKRKMNIAILGSAYFPTKTLQNELCWMKIGQSSQNIQSLEVESQHST